MPAPPASARGDSDHGTGALVHHLTRRSQRDQLHGRHCSALLVLSTARFSSATLERLSGCGIIICGIILIGGQRIQVGLPYAGKTAEITVGSDTYQITVDDGTTLTAPRTTSRDIKRHKAANYAPPQQPRSTLSL